MDHRRTSRAKLGLGAAIETFLNVKAEHSPHAWTALRAQVRHASLFNAGVRVADEMGDDALFDSDDASYSFVDGAQTWHLADVPMMELTLLSVAAPYPLGCVHGFGWTSNISSRRRPASVL
ncbi:hypothetical protein [Caballeronia sp. HLA56]